MYKLNNYIDKSLLVDKVINDQVKVENKILYVLLEGILFKYDQGDYYQKLNDRWINLQGGVPDYTLESDSNPDENIFHEVIE